jgi:hypothetical protein
MLIITWKLNQDDDDHILQQDRLIFTGKFATFWIVCFLIDGSDAMDLMKICCSGGHPGQRTWHPAISSWGAMCKTPSTCHHCPGICRSCRIELWLLWEEYQRICCSESGKKLTVGWMCAMWHEVHVLRDCNEQVWSLGSISMFWNTLNRFQIIIDVFTVIYNSSILFGRPYIN